MGSSFAVAPGNVNTVTGPDGSFTYSLYWPDDASWSASAVFRIQSSDGSEQHDFAKGDGTPSGSSVAFTFKDALPGTTYRGLLVDGDVTLSLFAAVDLCGLQHAADPCSFLPFPDLDDQKTGAADASSPDAADSAPPDSAPPDSAPPDSSPDSAPASDAGDAGDADAGSGEASDVDPSAVENAAGPPPSSADSSNVGFA